MCDRLVPVLVTEKTSEATTALPHATAKQKQREQEERAQDTTDNTTNLCTGQPAATARVTANHTAVSKIPGCDWNHEGVCSGDGGNHDL